MLNRIAISCVILATVSARPKQTECPEIISREEWGALPASENATLGLQTEVPYIFMHYSFTPPCLTLEGCKDMMRTIQQYDMDRGKADIGYNFLVGDDGRVYEGRGWDILGEHTTGYDDQGLGVCFIGQFRNFPPSQDMSDVYIQLAECALDMGKVATDYELKGHRQVYPTNCPGEFLYQEMANYPHWTDGDFTTKEP